MLIFAKHDQTAAIVIIYILTILGFGFALWGAYTVWLIVRNPDELTSTENHPSWRHMYLMMMAAQIGFALAYVF